MRNRAMFCYAQTLLELAQARQGVAKYADELSRLSEILKEDQRLKQRLEDPLLDLPAKKALLSEVSKAAQFDEIIHNFIQVMLDQHHEKDFEFVIQVFLSSVDELKGILRGKIDTAKPLSPENVSRLEAAFSKRLGQTVVLTQGVEPGLIGGLRVRIKDRIYDGSILNRLSDVFNQVSGEPAKAGAFRKDVTSAFRIDDPKNPKNAKEAYTLLDAEVYSAVPLTDEQQKALSAALSRKFGKAIHLTLQVKPELLGGLTVRVGDLVYDGSLSHRLDKMKKVLLQ